MDILRRKFLQFARHGMIICLGGRKLGVPPLGLKPVPHHQVLIFMSGLPLALIGAASNQADLLYIWDRATIEAKLIIALLFVFSIVAWWMMIFKAIQMRRARKLNALFGQE